MIVVLFIEVLSSGRYLGLCFVSVTFNDQNNPKNRYLFSHFTYCRSRTSGLILNGVSESTQQIKQLTSMIRAQVSLTPKPLGFPHMGASRSQVCNNDCDLWSIKNGYRPLLLSHTRL